MPYLEMKLDRLEFKGADGKNYRLDVISDGIGRGRVKELKITRLPHTIIENHQFKTVKREVIASVEIVPE
jgi:hypothetical protein